MGIYYTGPLLGPAIGAILGGGLTQGLGWRAIFWFLAIWGGLIFLAFLFLFKDTFRKERSSVYQSIVQRCIQERIAGEHPVVSDKTTSDGGNHSDQIPRGDVEAHRMVLQPPAIKEIKLSIVDVNPFPPYLRILTRKNNIIILFASGGYFPTAPNNRFHHSVGLFCAFGFSIVYTCARTLSLHYDYNAMKTGLVLLSYGIGQCIDS